MSFTVSINPTYFCNFNCDFCYLSEAQLKDRKRALLVDISLRLSEVNQEITHIDLYGGELGLLPDDYIDDLIEICKEHTNSICIITNLSAIRPAFLREDIQLSISYDFDAREKEQIVFNNMLKLEKPFSVLILASEKVIKNDVDFMITALNSLTNLISVEIKPYSSTTHRKQYVTDLDYENFIKEWIDNFIPKNWLFINQEKIEECLNGNYNAFSDDHVYITPNGKFGILDFDFLGNESFVELDTFKDYIKWTEKEKKYNVSYICRECKYFGGCLTEHYKYVAFDPKLNGCNGYYNLLEWYNEVSI
jgi:sulfatase maturation enzyme AslB (radical SAM superfamily)